MSPRIASAIFGCLAVAFGAFGAHGLEDLLERTNRVDVWETAAHYHLIHAVLLYIVASAANPNIRAWRFLASGIAIFSGSLYLLCLTEFSPLGAITPIGGLCLMVGWILLAKQTTPSIPKPI
jgi:uncharacterized membrane protein YgdD (TMEM256/DUF423 family)